jgi:tol-pal system protein YbgF
LTRVFDIEPIMTKPSTSKAVAAALAGFLICVVAGQALSQTPIDDDPLNDRSKRRLDNMEKVVRELRGIVFQGRNTGKPVVVQSAETDAVVQTLSQRVNDLELTLRRMTGDNETLQRDLDQSRRDLTAAQARAGTLEGRLSALEAKVAAGVAPPPLAGGDGTLGTLPAAPGPAASNPATAFAAANKLLLEGDYAGAEGAFSDFLAAYPDHARAPEANYRLGQTLTARKATADAAGAYIAAIRGYPKTAWAPDAMLELSRALVTLGDRPNACKVLSDLTARYPTAPTAVQSRAATTRAQARCAA